MRDVRQRIKDDLRKEIAEWRALASTEIEVWFVEMLVELETLRLRRAALEYACREVESHHDRDKEKAEQVWKLQYGLIEREHDIQRRILTAGVMLGGPVLEKAKLLAKEQYLKESLEEPHRWMPMPSATRYRLDEVLFNAEITAWTKMREEHAKREKRRKAAEARELDKKCVVPAEDWEEAAAAAVDARLRIIDARVSSRLKKRAVEQGVADPDVEREVTDEARDDVG